MSTSDNKFNSLCENLESCKLDVEKKISDEELFKQPPQFYGDCPICFIRLPTLGTGWKYQTCCGKVICSGCKHAPLYDNKGNKVDNKKCPFCRIPQPATDKENLKRMKQRVEADDPIAIHNTGCDYRDGINGYPQDYTKALELCHRAAKLGYAKAYVNIGYIYDLGTGVQIDKKKAAHYYELAAIGGDEVSRYNLALDEQTAGNIQRALKHFMIAVRGGDAPSLKEIQKLYSDGHVTKEDYAKALKSYQEYLAEIKSVQRDKAAAAHERYRYY